MTVLVTIVAARALWYRCNRGSSGVDDDEEDAGLRDQANHEDPVNGDEVRVATTA